MGGILNRLYTRPTTPSLRYQYPQNLAPITVGPIIMPLSTRDIPCNTIVITSMARNPGQIYVGGQNLSAIVTVGVVTSNGIELDPGRGVMYMTEIPPQPEMLSHPGTLTKQFDRAIEVISLKDIYVVSPLSISIIAVQYFQWLL